MADFNLKLPLSLIYNISSSFYNKIDYDSVNFRLPLDGIPTSLNSTTSVPYYLFNNLFSSYSIDKYVTCYYNYINNVSLENNSNVIVEEVADYDIFHGYLLQSAMHCKIDFNTFRFDMTSEKNQTTNSPYVVSSFGSLFSVNLQAKSFENKIPLYSIQSKNISLENFDYLINHPIFDYRIFHEDNQQNSVELFQENKSYVKISKTLSTGYCCISLFYGEKEVYNVLKELKEVKNTASITWVTSINNGRLQTKTLKSHELPSFTETAYSCFDKEKTVEQYMQDYLNSDSCVLLLYGPPGTGKTSLLRQLLKVSNSSALLTYNDNVADLDELFSYFHDSEEKFLIIEDADTYIASRNSGNSNMKKLLNITDGLTANPEKKVIFSSNLTSLHAVDSALLRPGRCFDSLKIGLLEPEQIAKFLFTIGKPELIPQFNSSKTLAEIYNVINGIQDYAPGAKSGFGLTP